MRYLILVVMLLIPVWGWAANQDPGFLMPGPWDGGTVDCRYWLSGNGEMVTAECKAREPITCEQRMREAMKSADKYLHGPWNEAWREYDKWKQAMKDCVEGK